MAQNASRELAAAAGNLNGPQHLEQGEDTGLHDSTADPAAVQAPVIMAVLENRAREVSPGSGNVFEIRAVAANNMDLEAVEAILI